MAENLAQEIRLHEEHARALVVEAKGAAAKSLADARAEAERSIKEARQRLHREYRSKIQEVEREADSAAQSIFALGKKESEQYLEESRAKVSSTAAWILKEVMGTHGLS